MILTLDDAHAVIKGRPIDLIALDDARNDLARLEPQQSRIVELRFFGGLSIEETAEAMRISTATVKRQWTTASAVASPRNEQGLRTWLLERWAKDARYLALLLR